MLDPNFVLDDEGRDRLIVRFGAGVDAWCAALPDLVERYCLRWHLELDKVLAGNTSRMFIGRQHGDRGVVLKLTPDLTIANEEAIALRAWAATPHAVDLLDADLGTGALLLENIEPGTKVSDQPDLPLVSDVAELLTGPARFRRSHLRRDRLDTRPDHQPGRGPRTDRTAMQARPGSGP